MFLIVTHPIALKNVRHLRVLHHVGHDGNSCCPDCLTIDTSNTDTFYKNGLFIHYRSSHPRKEFKENEAVQQGINLPQEFVAKEMFNNLQTLSEMRRNSVSV